MRLVLASASPRRADLLRAAGFDFDVAPADVDESVRHGELAATYVARVAMEKADAVSRRFPGRLVVAADTAVVVDGVVLGKPSDQADAARMLRLLSGRVHEVLTAVAACLDGRRSSAVERSEVAFAALTDEDVARYVGTGEPFDKAGGYAIQGLASAFSRLVSGPYDNVVGLPVGCVHRLLDEFGSAGAAPAPEN